MVRICPCVFLALAIWPAPVLGKPSTEDETEDNTMRLSLYGSALRKCDRPGYMAEHPDAVDSRFPHTGYARDDHCGSMSSDAGSHYVCVDLPRAVTAGGKVYSDFWTKTGQAGSPEQATTWPKPGPWCICMWAFARMRARRPEFSGMVDCHATNYWVVQNYDLARSDECHALKALCSACGLEGDQTKREGIRKKCSLARQICPGQDDAETCQAGGNCQM
mmetsp:Transcript_11762/g.35494  ORF Transcript_11762/g.35494 Transcript_11762/m.35494 type:complete len:219 (-) Transcript_11762:141-797(-)